ncbi:MAG: YcjF family protein [Pseudomonadota bacterium]
MDTPISNTAQIAPEEPVTWEIAEQWRTAWRSIRWIAGGLIAVLFLMAFGQIYLFYQMFADIHAALGAAFLLAAAGLFGWLIGVPLWRFFQAPAIAVPPDVDLKAKAPSRPAVLARLQYDENYLKRLVNNPALGDKKPDALQALEEIRSLKRSAKEKEIDALAGALSDFERDRMAPVLSDIDKRVDAYIHRESVAVGAATAVSMNGSIDAFIVLWRNVNMIARISHLYYGRPSLRLSMMIVRDVAVAVILSRALDDVTDAAGDALGGMVSRLGGMIVGPVMDGSVNALMTLKLGYVAKQRCRSFDVWNEARAARVTKDAFEQVRRESASVINDLAKICGGVAGSAADAAGAAAGVAADAAGKVLAAPKSAWALVQSTFARKTPASSEPATD